MQPSRVCPKSGGLIFTPSVEELQENQATLQSKLEQLGADMDRLTSLVGRVVGLLESKAV